MMILDLTYFIPGSTFLTYKDCELRYLLFYIFFYLMLCFSNEVSKGLKLNVKKNRDMSLFLIIVFVSIAFFLKIQYNGFSLKMNLSNVYEIRAIYATTNNSRLLSYLIGITIVIVPILMFMAIRKKRIFITVILMIVQLGMYSITADKTAFFFFILCLISGILPQISEKMIALSYSVVVLTSAIRCAMGTNPAYDVITDLLIRRMMILPNRLSLDYYTFFKEHKLVYLSQTILKHFTISQTYTKNISNIIGEWNGDFSNANNGLVGDAFANFGMAALVVYPVLYGLLFTFYNFCVKQCNKELILLSSLIIAIVLIESSFFTSLVTHGLIPLMIVLFLSSNNDSMTNRICLHR